ncbi:MAG: LON peptidase substrate-binding domain-containing protein [Thermomicrobiales bacterium]
MNDAPDHNLAAKVEFAAEEVETREAKAPRKRTSTKRSRKRKIALPVLVVDETLLMPHMSIPYAIEDDESAMVIERAMRMNPRQVLVLLEQMVENESTDENRLASDSIVGWTPDGQGSGPDWIFSRVGVIAEVGQRVTRPGASPHVMLQAVARGVVADIIQQDPYVVANVDRHDDVMPDSPDSEATIETVLEQLDHYVSMLPNVPEEAMTMVRSVREPGWLADMIAFSPEFSSEQRQELLEELDPLQRLRQLSVMVQKRLEILNLRQQIASEAQAGMDRQQREYYLREQMRAIQKELGEGSPEESVAREMRDKIESSGMPEEVQQKAFAQVERLEQQHPMSPEIGVIRTYLEWLTELPWSIETEDHLSLETASEVLNEDHYGLDKVKDRIIEYIAVRKLAGDKLRAPIICFVAILQASVRPVSDALDRSRDRPQLRADVARRRSR